MIQAPLVTILCATLNARLATRLTVETLFRYTPEPVRILVADNGSTDGTLRELKRFPAIETINVKARAKAMGFASRLPPIERLHGATLDWLAKQVETPFFLTLDSDVEFFQSGWLSSMLELAKRHQLAAVGELESANGAYQARLAPHVLLVDARRFRELGTSFRAFVTIDDPDEASRWCERKPDFCLDVDVMKSFRSARFYPTGAAFFEQLNGAGANWAAVAPGMGDKYKHLGHMSWAQNTRSGGKALQAHWGQTQEYLKKRLRLLSAGYKS
jgi:hypothetical protein